jgi:histidinol dehydrogenase
MKTFIIEDDADFGAAVRWCETREGDPSSDPKESERVEGVRALMEDVRARGDAAVAEITERFDHVALRPEQFEVQPEEIEQAYKRVDRTLVAALERAHDNIRRFHEKSVKESWEEEHEDGARMGQRVTPLDSVGVYVPGGTAFYPSSALMNIVPAKTAGVEEIVMVSPPTFEGGIHPLALIAARISGATRIFRVQGVAGIAALAYGTERIPAVVKITGPANAYVTIAKRIASAVCAIDKEAGPSDVVVMADEKTDPRIAAIEMICQAEHGADSPTTLVTTSKDGLEAVRTAIDEIIPTLSRADVIRQAIDDCSAGFVVRNLDEAARLVNVIAPEHLAIMTEVPMRVMDKINNAGAIMVGAGTPVAVCDYYAGPNHILPTGRRARFASPLTVDDFRKVSNYVCYSRERLRHDADDIIQLANAEGLTAHARSVEMRR